MIKHYVDIATRTLRKHPGYTLIHLAGLACGFAVALLIFLFVQHELSYDGFHTRADNIARLIAYREYGDGKLTPIAHTPLPLGPAMAEEMSSVRRFARISESDNVHVIAGDVQMFERIAFADPALFTMFDFPLIHGSTDNLFRTPLEAVVTEKTAKAYFGSTDVVGKTIDMVLQGDRRTFTIVGVARDVPVNSSIQFTAVVPITAIFRYEAGSTSWNWWRVFTYVEFDRPIEQVDAQVVKDIINKRWTDRTNKAELVPLELQPMKKVHLVPETGGSNPLYSYILAGIALIILVIAGINYVSLGIARGTIRAREVAMRKLFGAVRQQVVGQFLAESIILALLAVLVGFVLAELALPSFSAFVEQPLSMAITTNYTVLAFGLLMALVVGVGAGIVPAFLLSRPQPAEILRKSSRLARSGPIMRGMIVIQFALSTFLIIATIVMHQQNSHLQERPLGFSSESVMVVQKSPDKNINDLDFLQRFKNELAGEPLVTSISATSASFNQGYDAYGWETNNKHFTSYVYRVDPGYISTLQMQLVDGRDFAADPTQDLTNPIIVNESFMQQLGPEYSVGSKIPALDTMFNEFGTPTIVGVVKDYHFLSLHEQIGPVLLFTKEVYPYFQLLIRIDNRDIPAATAAVERAYAKVSSGLKCQWTYLDEDIARQYSNEQRWFKIMSSSAVFAISIAALGMFGLAGISTVRRSREVGIRKVLGATVFQVVQLVNREFLYMVLAANIIAWPIAWYAAGKWLQNFAYHIDLSLWSFALAALVAGGVAMLAVSGHTLKAALQNPSNVLRNE